MRNFVKVSINERAITKDIANALNRTLTKARNLQKEYIFKTHSIEKQYLNSRRLKGYRARQNNLAIKLTSTSKYITPFMQLAKARPSVGDKFGVQKNRKTGGKFYISSKPHKVSGYQVARGKLRGKDYYYIQKRANLDDELLEFENELNRKAVDIFNDELNKGSKKK